MGQRRRMRWYHIHFSRGQYAADNNSIARRRACRIYICASGVFAGYSPTLPFLGRHITHFRDHLTSSIKLPALMMRARCYHAPSPLHCTLATAMQIIWRVYSLLITPACVIYPARPAAHGHLYFRFWYSPHSSLALPGYRRYINYKLIKPLSSFMDCRTLPRTCRAAKSLPHLAASPAPLGDISFIFSR